jgi:steroid delta-isomerase-like uncharacterized protein
MSSHNKELSDRIFQEVWNERKLEAIDDLIATDYIHNDTQPVGVRRGIDAYKEFVNLYLDAFPDLRFTIQDVISADDKVVTRWSVTGTHNGDLPGLPRTGRAISLSGITIGRVSEAKFAESWNNWDALGMMQQLGAIPVEAKQQAA